jgi:hypothetical protein
LSSLFNNGEFALTAGSVTALPTCVPHNTSDRNTATRHSKLWRFILLSVKPRAPVSKPAGAERAFVLSEGGKLDRPGRREGCKEGLVGSEAFSLMKWDVPNFEVIFINLGKMTQELIKPVYIKISSTVHKYSPSHFHRNRN